MVEREALLALAERCEKATEASRELDALIWCALNGKRYVGHFPEYRAFGDGPDTQVEFTEPPKRTRLVTGSARYKHATPVTASLDAAMSLMPGDWRLSMLSSSSMAQRWSVNLWLLDGNQPLDDVPCGDAATPALALTAACLRARAAQGNPQ